MKRHWVPLSYVKPESSTKFELKLLLLSPLTLILLFSCLMLDLAPVTGLGADWVDLSIGATGYDVVSIMLSSSACDDIMSSGLLE